VKVKRTAEEISERLQQLLVVGIARLRDADLVVEAATTAAAHGLRALEVPFTVPDAARAIALLRERLGADAVVGAGTVRTAAQLEDAVRAGAEFLVAPGLNPSLVGAAQAAGTLLVPGVYTASEVDVALGLGLRLLKLFPAVPAGPAYLAAVQQPFPEARFMPAGGIGPENAAAFLRAGAVALGVGSSVFPAERIDREGTAVVGDLTRATLAAAANRPA
jgi:2-dehydro-3-deoxyphosphogluconate aldolase/(4S)-4-hydroxy-2-oxoglutarate aldolase